MKVKIPNIESVFMHTARAVTFDKYMGEIRYLDFHSSTVDDPNKISFSPQSQVFKLEHNTLFAVINHSQKIVMKENFGIDLTREVFNELITVDTLQAEKKLLDLYFQLGEKNSGSVLFKRQNFLKKIFKKMKFPHYAQTGEEVLRKIRLFSNLVAVSSRKGLANFAVVNSRVYALLRDCPDFVIAPEFHIPFRGVYFAGTVNNITIFVDPKLSWEKTRVLVGRKTYEGESGVYWIEGERDLQEIQEYSLVPSTRLIVRTSRSIFSTINSERNFLTQLIKIKKKPIWKRILKV